MEKCECTSLKQKCKKDLMCRIVAHGGDGFIMLGRGTKWV